MRVEKKFYTEEALLWQRAEQMAAEETANCSEDELGEDKRPLSQKEQESMDEVLNDRKNLLQVIQSDRLDFFETICQNAMELAEAAPLDIVAETESSFGKISFRADRLMILSSAPSKLKEILVMLIREADSSDFAVGDGGLLEMTFVFSFTTKKSGRTSR
ncbi:MAG: hypothetical protein LUG56_08320 [Lachnospiraceae bacterium]|nr:hypothetical protein [Lachnospiraceae bacterium]MCD7842456.1 hypothetical protein [Lachnospiraceae bacterium]